MERETRKFDQECNRCVIVPPVDIYEEEHAYTLKADLPGIAKESLDISLDNRELTITGKCAQNTAESSYAEFSVNDYKRSFTIDDDIDAKGITASLENGVLTLTLPKSEKAKPRQIEIIVH